MRMNAVTATPAMAPNTLAVYRKLKLFLSPDIPRMKAIMKGKVVPMKKHQGNSENNITIEESHRYRAESESPAAKRRFSPKVNKWGTANAPRPVNPSMAA